MTVALLFCIISVLLCLRDRNRPPTKFGGLEMAFITLTVFLSIRYGFGNDYDGYLMNFHNYASFSYGLTDFEKWASLQARGEYGFVVLNKLFEPVGFFGFIIFLSAFSLYAIYRLIKKYVSPDYYWFSVFILAFNPSFLIVGIAGAIRQWLAVTLFLFSFDFIKNKKIIPFVVVMFVASTIHKSSLAILPCILLALVDLNKFDRTKIILSSVCIVVWFILIPRVGYSLFLPLFQGEEMEYYTGYMAANTGYSIFGISSLLVIGVPFVCLSQINEMHNDVKLMCILLMCSILFVPMVSVNVMIGRLAWYFSIFSIVVYPNTIEVLLDSDKITLSKAIILSLMLYYIYIFITHFLDPVWYETSYHFHTIFEHPWQ